VAERTRNTSVDLLRGLVMVIMALDHARDYFTSFGEDPTNLKTTTIPLFFTRFVTHYCAPVFVFLAGTGAYLSRSAGKPVGDLSRFLLTRGLWLVLLELTAVRFTWLLDVSYRFTVLQVIWAIGWSMVVLAALVWIDLRFVIAFAAIVILGHNLLDPVHANGSPMWSILHEQNFRWEPVPGHRVAIIYPLIPWVGVMALGYACGAWLVRPEAERRRVLLRVGVAATVAFVALRASNLYGDPHPWTAQKNAAFTLLSFLNVEKYPPSLCYLLITLGPALVFLSLADRASGPVARLLTIYGRVPLFYYLLHVFLINVTALAIYLAKHGHPPTSLGYEHYWPLWGVYGIWIAVVAVLYPACRWYAEKKRTSRSVILSYL
jgi:uncharacterized membrane protein